MKLPTLDTYAFPVTVPSTGQKISMRPFLVREEKLLLMAQESENPEEQIEAVAQIIRNCTNGAIEPNTTPYFDIEYLLLQLRARSVNDVVKPVYECNRILPETKEKCQHRTPISISLNDIAPPVVDSINERSVIKLSERYTLKLKYPNIFTVNKLLLSTTTASRLVSNKTLNILCDLFAELIDHETDTTYNFDDYSEADKIEFLNGLAPADYEKLVIFIRDMPAMFYETSYTCAKCQFEHKIILTGLTDFLG